MRFFTLPCGMLEVNTYVLGAEDTDACVVIDPGEAQPVLSLLAAQGLHCEKILLTHGHFDHIMGLAALKAASNAEVYVHAADAGMLLSSRASLATLIQSTVAPVTADVLLQGGETIGAAGLQFRVLHTPGHTPGGVCYVLDSEQMVFCGDTIFRDSVGRTDFPHSSAAALYAGIENQLMQLADDYRLYPGHGPATDIGYERKNNPFLLYGNERW